MSKICIDPGHGGYDPGALGKKSKEKENVLKVAKRLKVLLESYGHEVKLTRSTDVYLSLSERARIANEWGADYFVSLHDNSATATATGFETFIYNGSVTSATIELQNAIHSAIIKEIGIRDRGKKRANFAVVRETKMPAVLIEYAFISNVTDEKILINDVEKLAQLTANGIIDYVGGRKPAPSTPKPTPTPEAPKSKQRGVATVTVPTLSLRMAPSVKGKLIRTLKKGEAYKVWDEQGGWLRLGKDMWASWQDGAYMDWTEKPTKSQSKPNKPAAPRTFSLGQRVKIKSSATKYATGQSIPSQYKNKTYTIQQLKTDRVLIKELVSWVYMKDLA